MFTMVNNVAWAAYVKTAPLLVPLEDPTPTPSGGVAGLNYTPKPPPGIGASKITDLLGYAAYVGLAICMAYLIINAVRLARSNRRDPDAAVDTGFDFGKLAIAGVIISGGYKIAQWLWF